MIANFEIFQSSQSKNHKVTLSVYHYTVQGQTLQLLESQFGLTGLAHNY